MSDSPECGVCLAIQLRIRTAVYPFGRIPRNRRAGVLKPCSGRSADAIADALRLTLGCIAIAGRDCDADS